MPTITLTVNRFNLPQSGPVWKALEREVARAANEILHRMKTSMTGPKHGRFYRVGSVTKALGKGGRPFKGARTYTTAKGNVRVIVGAKVYQASAPGEAPAVRPSSVGGGHLLNAIQATPVKGSGGLKWVVSVGAEYGAYQEYGTSKMLPRPYAEPAITAVRPAFLENVKGIVGNLWQ